MKTLQAKYTATEFFSQFSTTYVRHATWSKDIRLNDIIVDIVTNKHPRSIVDFGTGNGELLSLFPDVPSRIGIDISPQMLALIPDPNIVKLVGDIHRVALPTASVDFVVCRQVLHYCRPTVVLLEAHRILQSAGYLLVVHATDCETVPPQWYAQWKTFKRIKHRKHLTTQEIIHYAAQAHFRPNVQECCHVDVEFCWSDLFHKYAASTKAQRDTISAFFRETPESIAKDIHLKIDEKRLSYQRTFTCFLFSKNNR